MSDATSEIRLIVKRATANPTDEGQMCFVTVPQEFSALMKQIADQLGYEASPLQRLQLCGGPHNLALMTVQNSKQLRDLDMVVAHFGGGVKANEPQQDRVSAARDEVLAMLIEAGRSTDEEVLSPSNNGKNHPTKSKDSLSDVDSGDKKTMDCSVAQGTNVKKSNNPIIKTIVGNVKDEVEPESGDETKEEEEVLLGALESKQHFCENHDKKTRTKDGKSKLESGEETNENEVLKGSVESKRPSCANKEKEVGSDDDNDRVIGGDNTEDAVAKKDSKAKDLECEAKEQKKSASVDVPSGADYAIGTTVLKNFPLHGWCKGKIEHIDEVDKEYTVGYVEENKKDTYNEYYPFGSVELDKIVHAATCPRPIKRRRIRSKYNA